MTENTSPPSVIAPVPVSAPAPVIAGPDPQSMSADDDEISLLDLLQVVADNLRLLVLGPLVAGLLALGYSFTITPTFTATTKFLPPQQQQSGAAAMLVGLGALGGLADAAMGLKNPADQYITFLKSNSVRDGLIGRFKILERLQTSSLEDARSTVDGSIQISSSRDGLIAIAVSDKDPNFAAQLANAHIEELGKLLKRLAVTEAQQRRSFFEKQLKNAKDNLIEAEQALASSGVNSSVLKTSGAAVATVAQLNGYIVAQEIKLANMRGYLSESAPDFRQAQIELAALRAQLGRAENAAPSSGGNVGDADFIAKFRNFKYNETLVELFTKQYEVARIDESREGVVIQVLDVARVPEHKSKPNKMQITMLTAAFCGFSLIILIFVRQGLRDATQSRASAAKLNRLRNAWNKAIGGGLPLR